ncbi:Flippase kinase 1 [Gossypium arboreum]|uniref:Flippase kinase 1 n=1 Tax=Gossypium arboreum TaxID=29729 RepID=A0A0B0PJA4_GOSAR|nr:Flippase kinase 1 [Gossypium arboreum]
MLPLYELSELSKYPYCFRKVQWALLRNK